MKFVEKAKFILKGGHYMHIGYTLSSMMKMANKADMRVK